MVNAGGPTTGPMAILFQIPGLVPFFPSAALPSSPGDDPFCVVSPEIIRCVFSETSAPNGEIDAPIIAAAAWDAPSSIELCVQAATGGELNLTNNKACQTYPVVTTPQCDLVVEKERRVSGTIKYEIVVTWDCKSAHAWSTIEDVTVIQNLPGDQPVEVLQVDQGSATCGQTSGFHTAVSCNLGDMIYPDSQTIEIFIQALPSCDNETSVDPANLIKETDETNNITNVCDAGPLP